MNNEYDDYGLIESIDSFMDIINPSKHKAGIVILDGGMLIPDNVRYALMESVVTDENGHNKFSQKLLSEKLSEQLAREVYEVFGWKWDEGDYIKSSDIESDDTNDER
jgi:hypothetical protein